MDVGGRKRQELVFESRQITEGAENIKNLEASKFTEISELNC